MTYFKWTASDTTGTGEGAGGGALTLVTFE